MCLISLLNIFLKPKSARPRMFTMRHTDARTDDKQRCERACLSPHYFGQSLRASADQSNSIFFSTTFRIAVTLQSQRHSVTLAFLQQRQAHDPSLGTPLTMWDQVPRCKGVLIGRLTGTTFNGVFRPLMDLQKTTSSALCLHPLAKMFSLGSLLNLQRCTYFEEGGNRESAHGDANTPLIREGPRCPL